jgi:hypothetical protein
MILQACMNHSGVDLIRSILSIIETGMDGTIDKIVVTLSIVQRRNLQVITCVQLWAMAIINIIMAGNSFRKWIKLNSCYIIPPPGMMP